MRRVERDSSRTVDLLAESRLLSSGERWRGLKLHEARSEAQEMPEGYLLAHAAFLMTRAPESDIRLPDRGWQSVVPSLRTIHFFPAQLPFSARTFGPSSVIGLEISPELVSAVQGPEPTQRGELLEHATCVDNFLVESVLALAEDVRAGFPCGRIYGESVGAAFVAQLLRKCSTTRFAEARFPAGTSNYRLRQVFEYINDNLASDLSLLRLASIAETGVDNLLRLFKRSTGLTPHQYVLRKRIERAQALLAQPRLSITDIALQSGFVDHSHFARIFRRTTGVSPRVYRNLVRR